MPYPFSLPGSRFELVFPDHMLWSARSCTRSLNVTGQHRRYVGNRQDWLKRKMRDPSLFMPGGGGANGLGGGGSCTGSLNVPGQYRRYVRDRQDGLERKWETLEIWNLRSAQGLGFMGLKLKATTGGLWSSSPPISQTLCHRSNSITNLW